MSSTRILLQFAAPVLAAAFLGALPARAEQAPWTSAGSAGTVVESDLLLVQLGAPVAGAVSMRVVPRGRVRVRYNVVAVGNLADAPDVSLTARFLDGGELQRVILSLKEYDLRTGLTNTLLTLDSDNYAPSPAFQFQTVNGTCHTTALLDFVNHAYFVDAVLSRVPFALPPGPPGSIGLALPEPDGIGPALGVIKVDRSADCAQR